LSGTDALRVGHLVLCANFRNPILLGKMVTTLAAIAPGRFILGLGSGSTRFEHEVAGLPWGSFDERSQRLAETLDIVCRMTRGATVGDVAHAPHPATPPPVMVGGKGRRTLDLVARYADWWNCPTYALRELPTLLDDLASACAAVGRDPAGVGISTESVLALVPHERDVPDARALAQRRFAGPMWGLRDGFVGTPDSVVPQLHAAIELGVRQFVFFLHDRVTRATLDLLANEVVAPLRGLAMRKDDRS
jgi:alkanesulfonate monooxygenase SsuD/methylene tetrahydromethanopterin reductase-like flavin-dependent oxidoreductase (luciferase family)